MRVALEANNTKIIVEGDLDRDFFKGFFKNVLNIETKSQYELLADEMNDKMTDLSGILREYMTKPAIENILIIRDHDKYTTAEKLKYTNIALAGLYDGAKLEKTFEWKTFGDKNIALALIGIEEKGELETIIHQMKRPDKPSVFADCVLKQLPACMKDNHAIAKLNKEMIKIWVSNYLKIDNKVASFKDPFWHKNSPDYFNYRQSIPCLEKLQALFGSGPIFQIYYL